MDTNQRHGSWKICIKKGVRSKYAMISKLNDGKKLRNFAKILRRLYFFVHSVKKGVL